MVTRCVDRDGITDTVSRALYGELAAMMPKAGGQYVYLREAYSPLWGFLYGWTLFLVIQTGTIAAVAVGFARYSGVLLPWVSESNYIIAPIRFGGYAVSLSTAQLVGPDAHWISDIHEHARFGSRQTYPKCFYDCKNWRAVRANRARNHNRVEVRCRRGKLQRLLDGAGVSPHTDLPSCAGLTAAAAFGLFVGICVAQDEFFVLC